VSVTFPTLSDALIKRFGLFLTAKWSAFRLPRSHCVFCLPATGQRISRCLGFSSTPLLPSSLSNTLCIFSAASLYGPLQIASFLWSLPLRINFSCRSYPKATSSSCRLRISSLFFCSYVALLCYPPFPPARSPLRPFFGHLTCVSLRVRCPSLLNIDTFIFIRHSLSHASDWLIPRVALYSPLVFFVSIINLFTVFRQRACRVLLQITTVLNFFFLCTFSSAVSFFSVCFFAFLNPPRPSFPLFPPALHGDWYPYTFAL